MRIETFSIEGPVLFTPKKHGDARGFFAETFRAKDFEAAAGMKANFVQDNLSVSTEIGTLRGLHYQAPPHAQGKLVSCQKGRIMDVIIDDGPQGEELLTDPDVRFSNPNPEAFRDASSYRSQARLERNFGDKTLALTPYIRHVDLRFLRHFVPGQALEENSHWSVGVQSALYTQDWNIGLDAEYTEGRLFEFQDNPTAFSFTQGLHYDYEVESLVGAVYAQKDFYLGLSLIHI